MVKFCDKFKEIGTFFAILCIIRLFQIKYKNTRKTFWGAKWANANNFSRGRWTKYVRNIHLVPPAPKHQIQRKRISCCLDIFLFSYVLNFSVFGAFFACIVVLLTTLLASSWGSPADIARKLSTSFFVEFK